MSIGSSVSSLMFHPITVSALENLNQEGAASLLVRDGLQNVGIVNETKKENKDLAAEMNLVMWTTWLVWGGGAFALKKGYFQGIKKLFPHLAMANKAESDIRDARHGVQQFTPELAKQYQAGLMKRVAHASDGLKREASHLAQNYQAMASESATKLLQHMNVSKLGGILVAGGIPALATGFILPAMAQKYSKNRLSKRAMASREAEENRMLGRPLEPTASSSRLLITPPNYAGEPIPTLAQNRASWQAAKHAQQAFPATQTGTSVPGPMPTPHRVFPLENDIQIQNHTLPDFNTPANETDRNGHASAIPAPRSAQEFLWKGVNFLNNNTNMTNVLVVDATVSGGRVLNAEDNSDRIRWAIYEAIFVYMMYFGSPQIRNMIQQNLVHLQGFEALGIRSMNESSHLKNMNFNSLARLKEETLKNPNALQAFKKNFDKGIQALGISAKDLSKMKQAFESFMVHSHLQNDDHASQVRETLEKETAPIIQKIRQHMLNRETFYEPGENLVLDMLHAQSILPVHRENWLTAVKEGRGKNPRILGLDISQTMNSVDENGENGVANMLYRMEQIGKRSTKDVERMLNVSHISHSVGIGASLVAGFLVMGHLSPLLQSWLSKKVTGQSLPGRLDESQYGLPEKSK
jgi:hypothetical protein